MGDHLVDHLALQIEVGARVAEDQAVPGAARDILGAPHDQREERVRHVGDDQRERPRALRREAARQAARDVPELVDRLLDPPTVSRRGRWSSG